MMLGLTLAGVSDGVMQSVDTRIHETSVLMVRGGGGSACTDTCYISMALPSMISSLSQNAPVPSYVCEDVVGKQQLTIDVLYAMIKQEITHSCGLSVRFRLTKM